MSPTIGCGCCCFESVANIWIQFCHFQFLLTSALNNDVKFQTKALTFLVSLSSNICESSTGIQPMTSQLNECSFYAALWGLKQAEFQASRLLAAFEREKLNMLWNLHRQVHQLHDFLCQVWSKKWNFWHSRTTTYLFLILDWVYVN